MRAYDLTYKDMFENKLDLGYMNPLLNAKEPWYFQSLEKET